MALPAVRDTEDHLDLIVAQWGRTWPELDTELLAVVGRLLRVGRHLEREIERVLAQFDLGLSEFNILAALRRATPPRLSPADLSRSLIISSGGVVKRIDRLEHEGLVRRVPHPTDRRGLLVELTPAGRGLIEEAVLTHIENERRLMATVGKADRDRLASILRNLLIALEADGSA